jgi:diguanylate cyclase (GGDEF)-like protein/PAS domain S-box-containing protein
MTFLTLIANFIILTLEQTGFLVNPLPLPASNTRWFIQTAYTLLAALYIWTTEIAIRSSLRESGETADRYRALFDRTNDGVVIYDLEWNVISANTQAAELLGYTLSEIVERNAATWESSHQPQEMNQSREQILEGQNIPIFEEILVRKDGTQVPVELNMALVHDGMGRAQHIQCIMRDITERKDYEYQLQQQALYDPLTNLPNRTLFENRYRQVGSARDQNLVAMLFVDLDNFKWVNDKYGHAVGDQVLQELGKRLEGSLRETDTVARLGGDEFVIILENIRSKEDVSKIAEKILNNISLPLQMGADELQVTASIGIHIEEKRNLPYVDLLKSSDYAMYQVKDSGKNGFQFFESGL